MQSVADTGSIQKNLLRSTARELLNEFESPTNKLTFRQLLDKHAVKIAPYWPKRPPAWLRLNCEVHRVREGK
ncbi:MAG TPA: hypothetical protein DHV72_23035 [Serratia grimesii]|uniref:Uncharacterized protein n=1 Tax=Serratia grimesii TaxID=82995 RepID=A0A9C7R1I7_9GAMM|nr:hypothetical protein CR62_24085 [Serratia grimesii]HCK02877.1 hypothetical protein [Serratia grimesii]